MKKNNLYLVAALILGLLLGGLIFGNLFDGTVEREEPNTSVGHQHANEGNSQMWTCSMHPQIMQTEPGDCPICGMDLIPAESKSDPSSTGEFKMTKNAIALANISTTRLSSSSLGNQTLDLSGTIEENEKAVAVQASYFKGRIEKMYINFEGEEVRKGQLLATLYAPEIISAQQELLTALDLKSAQPSLYAAVRNKLKLWKLTDRQIDEIEASRTIRENFPVYAHVSGTVSEVMVETGDYVEKGTPLFKIADLGEVWAVFDAYENQVSFLSEGQRIDIQTKSYPDTSYEAIISFVDPILNAATRTVRVRAILDNREGKLKPGMFVTGTLQRPSIGDDSALIVPESAVLWTGNRSVVYIKTDTLSPTFELREVQLGKNIDGGYTVLSGVKDGEEVVTHGAFTVDAAAQLKGKKSMMSREGEAAMTGHEGHQMKSK